MQTSTLRPGLLVSLRTSVRGNVKYWKTILENERIEEGTARAKWETERTIVDPEEFELARKVRSSASGLIRKICSYSAFGQLCPMDKAADLEDAITAARKLADEFNATSKITKVDVYVLTGQVASDDMEAVKAINSEVRELIEEMADGVQRQDVKAIREAAARAKQLGDMLSIEAAAKVQLAVDAARDAAKKIAEANGGPVEGNTPALNRIRSATTLFLDDEGQDRKVALPRKGQAALDLAAAE